MHKLVALMDSSFGEHMLLQNLQIVCSSQCIMLLVMKKRPHLPLFPLKAPHTIDSQSIHRIDYGMYLESYLDDPD